MPIATLASANDASAAELVEALRSLHETPGSDPLDRDVTEQLSEALYKHYLRSTEASSASNDPLEGPRILAECALIHARATITTLDSRQLEDILFESIPAIMPLAPNAAGDIIQSSRAFFVWLKRELAHDQARELIELLGDDAVHELEQRLADPYNHGPAKSMMLDAVAAGVDMSSEQAISDFMAGYQGHGPSERTFLDPFADQFPPSSTPHLSPEQRQARQKKRKKNRKSARKARKKHR